MYQLKPQIRQIATVSGIIVIAVIAISLVIFGIPPLEVFFALLRAGTALTITGAFWFLYDRLLWRIDFFRMWGWLSPVPNLNGRWEGVIRRDENDVEHAFVIEIIQTYSSFQYQTFTKNSTGRSTTVAITKTETGNIFGVTATWETTTVKIGDPEHKETFRGASHWRVTYEDRPGKQRDRLKIVDDYHTNRSTTGHLEVTRKSFELRNAY